MNPIESLRAAADKLEAARHSHDAEQVREALREVSNVCHRIAYSIDEQLDPSPVERVMRQLSVVRR